MDDLLAHALGEIDGLQIIEYLLPAMPTRVVYLPEQSIDFLPARQAPD